MENLHITVVDGNQQAQTFAAISEAVAYILRYPQAIFSIYAPRDMYVTIRKQVFERENREDYNSIYNYGTMKGSGSSWGDINDFDDMIATDSQARTSVELWRRHAEKWLTILAKCRYIVCIDTQVYGHRCQTPSTCLTAFLDHHVLC